MLQTFLQTSALGETKTVGAAGVVLLITREQVRSTPRFDWSSLYKILTGQNATQRKEHSNREVPVNISKQMKTQINDFFFVLVSHRSSAYFENAFIQIDLKNFFEACVIAILARFKVASQYSSTTR